jgi:CRP-like cAMP-binding protein
MECDVAAAALFAIASTHWRLLDSARGERIALMTDARSAAFESPAFANAERFVLRAVPAGALIVEQGTPPPGLFVVLHGEADVWVTDAATDGRARVAVLHEGDVFGELSLLTGAATTASVVAPRGAVLLHLGPADFAAVRDDLPAVVTELVELSEARRGELEEMVGTLADEGSEEVVDDAWLVPA